MRCKILLLIFAGDVRPGEELECRVGLEGRVLVVMYVWRSDGSLVWLMKGSRWRVYV